jgi:hypothetical protein
MDGAYGPAGRKWQTGDVQRKLSPAQWVGVFVVHTLIASLVWRDLRHRTEDQVRGSRRMWRIASAANSANSVLYLLVGRKRIEQTEG